MNNIIFREEKLIDREKEIKFIKDWFVKIPKEILWIYGPKSTGKTTLIEYIIENELSNNTVPGKAAKKYWVKYINLRGKLLSSYDTFLNSFFSPTEEGDEELGLTVNLGVFKIDYKKYNKIKNKTLDLFETLIDEFRIIAETHRIIIAIDEIQVLEDIYINGERELLKEFLNFCVRLTKELHLAHVVILSGNTIFIDKIYNDAKLKVTSEFYKIDHLDKDITVEWLKQENFNNDEIELIWDYLGGCIPRIQRLLRKRDSISSLTEYLKNEARIAYSEIVDLYRRGDLKISEKKVFEKIVEKILQSGDYTADKNEKKEYTTVIDFFSEKEILFFDPISIKVTGNNRTYEKAFAILLNQ